MLPEHDDYTPSFNPDLFRERVYGITGAANGIGEATARVLCNLGATVLGYDLDETNLRRVESSLQEEGCAFYGHRLDVSDIDALTQHIDDGFARHGRWDGWLNNAYLHRPTPIEHHSSELYYQTWAVNVHSAWHAIRTLIPHMRASGGGSIVSTSSTLGHRPWGDVSVYAGCKAALEAISRDAAVELAEDRIRVNTVVPGFIDTAGHHRERLRSGPPMTEVERQMIDLHRQSQLQLSRLFAPWRDAGRPIHVANAVVFLFSPAANFITGINLPVDGGQLASFAAPWKPGFRESLQEMESIGKQMQELHDKQAIAAGHAVHEHR